MDVLSEVKFLKARVALLETEKKHLIQKVVDLKKKESEAPNNILPSRINTPLSVSAESISDYPIKQKIQLLRNIFRGREDVHARYWISKKTGKRGYSPVCKNEWIRNICKKPTIKCSVCPNRELSPLTDDIIKKHLEGVCSIGIYPMLSDETCYFLAIDFDGEGWIDNISAFNETCYQKSIPVAIERSKSGDGAHAWIFFEEKIPAALARRMGSF